MGTGSAGDLDLVDSGTIVSGKSMLIVLCIAIGTILGELIGSLNPSTVIERRRALEWMVSDEAY